MGREGKRAIVHPVRSIVGTWKAMLGCVFVNQISDFREFISATHRKV